jgi:hypothetical protein
VTGRRDSDHRLVDRFPELDGALDSGSQPLLGRADPFDAILRSLGEARVADAAGARMRTRWLVRQSEEEGTIAGVLVDLAEQGDPIVLTTRSSRLHIGRVRAMGADFVALHGPTASTLLVRLAAVAMVRSRPGSPVVTGDRTVRLERRFHDVLGDLAGERPSVVVGTDGGEVTGQLRAVGRDVATVRVNASTTVYVPVDAASDVWVRR